MSDLTEKQRRWLEAYLVTLNATEAARRAGYTGSPQTLGSMGKQNLHNPKLRAAINARLAEMALSTDKILAMIAAIARGSLEDFLNADGSMRLDAKNAAVLNRLGVIKKFRLGPNGVEVQLYDRLAALKLLCKALGLLRRERTARDADGKRQCP